MNWFVTVVVIVSFLTHQYFVGIVILLAYWLWKPAKETFQQRNIANEQNWNQPEDKLDLSAGDLADLVLLRLELQTLFNQGEIDAQQHAELTQQIDILCTRYLAEMNAVSGNALWKKHRDEAWNILNVYADVPLGIPPWRIKTTQQPEPIVTVQPDLSQSNQPEPNLSQTTRVSSSEICATPLTHELKPTAAHLIVETDLSSPINPFAPKSGSDTTTKQPATFAIDETDHSSTLPYQTTKPQLNKPDSSLNQYAWKPSEPSRLERALKTVSGWHSMAIPFLAQNIGWFIGVFCFIAGSIFLVAKTDGYTSNLIAFFSFLIFTLALLFGGYQLRNKRPELEASSYVIFILSLLLIPLTNIAGTQLLINSDGSFLKLLFGFFLVIAELGLFYFAVTLVAGLMDKSLQQGLPKFFLALTAMQLLQMLLLALPYWQLLAVIHLLLFALLSFSIYLFAKQWLQAIFIDQHRTTYFAAGTLIYSAVVSFVFITAGNSINLPDGYYGFFLMLLCGLLFFIDAQLKQWIEQYAYLSRFSFLVYGLSVLALCLVAQQPFAIPTLILAIALYAFIVWRYLTLTPLTILLSCYFWLYGVLVLQHLLEPLHMLASLPLLFSLYKAAQWALNKRQSAYLAVIIYRVLYSLLAVLTVWSLYHSEAGLTAMATAITASVLIYYTLKAAPVAIFNDYANIASAEEDVINRLSKKSNLLSSHWFYAIPALAGVTIYYTPRFLTDQVQCSLGLSLLAIFWAYRGLSTFFKANSMSDTTPIELRLNSALLSLFVAVLPLWTLTDNLERVAPLFLVALIMLWLSHQLLTRWLVYGALLAFTLAILPLKAIYFPTPSGLVTMLMGIGLWFWLWYMERQESTDLTVLKREQATQKRGLLPSCKLLGWSRFPGFAALYKDVIDTPLEQVMCLFWLLGMKTLFERFFNNQLSYAWLAAVFLVSLFSLLLIIRYRLIKLLPIPIALVLAAVLLMLNFWQLDIPTLLLASVLFALLLWQSVTHALPRPFFTRLSETLNPALPNDFEEIGIITHLTAFFIVMVCVIAQLLSATAHSLIVLLTLLTTVVFLWLSDRSYQQIITRYLVLGFSVLAGVELISLSVYPFNWQTVTTDDYSALLFVSLSLVVAGLTFPRTSYDKPAANIAIFLAFASVFLQLLQTALITPLDYSVLFLAGGSLLVANAKPKWAIYNFSAFMILVLATLWLEHSLYHAQLPFNLWLTVPFTDLWLTLAVLSLAISLLSRWLKAGQSVEDCYLPPLNTVATLCYVWSLLGTLTVFFASAGRADLLPWILSVLLLALFPLSKNRSGGVQIRGIGCASLLTLTLYCLLPVGLDGFALQNATVLWGYALWLFASFVLPPFNKCNEECAVEPLFFACLGFLLVAFSGYWWQSFDRVSIGAFCLELSVYSVLMLRYSSWAGFSWLSAFALTISIIIFNFDSANLPILLLLWANMQLLLITICQSTAKKLVEHWQWQHTPLPSAYEFTSKFIFAIFLLITSIVLWLDIVNVNQFITVSDHWLIGILLNLSYLHLLWRRFSTNALHLFIYTVLLSFWILYVTCLSTVFHPPSFLTFWSLLLFTSMPVLARFNSPYQNSITAAISIWLKFFVGFATVGLLYYSMDNLAERLLSLAIIAGLSAKLAGRTPNSPWLFMAGLEVLLFLHSWPLLLLENAIPSQLLPWYALQNTLLATLSIWFLNRLLAKSLTTEDEQYYRQALQGSSWLIVLSLLELFWHGVLFQQSVIAGASPDWLAACATLGTALIINIIGLRHIRQRPDSKWLYGIVALFGAMAIYSRLLWLGAAYITLWDTAAIISSAYILFLIQGLYPSKPLYNSALFTPALALFTVPLQLATPETSLALMATGLLYLLVRHQSQQKLPLYLAILVFNAGVYLWIPSLVDRSQLIQVYVIPAALSVLMLLHLHSRELKPSVLMGSRLAAISSIYACATADVFLRDEQSILVFILAMGLSIAGIVQGIALRTRAFLYAGVSFLLLNVIGQLLHFYPEQGMGKAIVLMVMGAGITGFMIWFNIKRVEILERINAIQAQLQTWD